MLPQTDLPLRLVDNKAYLDFLGPEDEPWIRILIGELQRFSGQRQRQLAERLAEPLPCDAPHFKRRAASRVLLRLWKRERVTGVRPSLVREVVFTVAAASDADRARILAETAVVFGMSRAALEEMLFGDLPGERVVCAPDPVPVAAEVIRRTNLAIAQAALMRAATIDLCVEGAVRPIVRLAKLRGLLCVVKAPGESAPPVLEVSGPFSLFRHTLLYGRALAELLPHLAWCARFSLRARCDLRGRLCEVELDKSAPIFPATPPRPFDSKVEQRFAADLGALALDWDVVREPEPLRADGTLIFPDFLLRHRLDPQRRVFIEVVGFWTPEYLAKKFARLRSSGIINLILCLDEERDCAAGELPLGLPVVRYRRYIDAAAVLAEAQRMTRRDRMLLGGV